MLAEAAYWGLDPLYWTHIPLFVRQIHEIPRDPSRGCEHALFLKRPVNRVSVLGNVVGLTVDGKKRVIQVDDGTGVITCIDFVAGPTDRQITRRLQQLPRALQDGDHGGRRGRKEGFFQATARLELGSVVHVQGKLKLAQGVADLAGLEIFHGVQYSSGDLEKGRLVASCNDNKELVPTRMIFSSSVRVVCDPNEELAHWVQVENLSKQIYMQAASPDFQQAWQAHHNNYCRTNTSTSADSGMNSNATASLKKALVKLMTKDHYKDIESILTTLPQLCSRTDVWQAVQAADPLFDKRRLADLLRSLLAELCEDGDMYTLNGAYGVVDEDNVIVPAILTRLARFAKEYQGVRRRDLLASIQLDPRCAKVKQSRFDIVLDKLIHKGSVIALKGYYVKLAYAFAVNPKPLSLSSTPPR